MTWTSNLGARLEAPHQLVESASAVRSAFRNARFVSEPDRGLGLVCGIATA
jgi:hypothetical protein